MRSSGTFLAVAWRSAALLNVTMPENEIWKPSSSACFATSQVSVKQCITPPASRAFSSRITRSVSSADERVWMISGLPVCLAARIWVRKRSRCHSMSAMLRPLSR
ncbi:hypothetical protein D3C81_1832310 [compost metagenome]